MFQFTPFPSAHYGFMYRCAPIAVRGFPHSEICGSSDICSSPQLIAACHVLLRLPVPRHPPYALSYLTNQVAWRSVARSFFTIAKLNREILVFSVRNRSITLRIFMLSFVKTCLTVNTRYSFSIFCFTLYYSVFNVHTTLIKKESIVVENTGFEPATPCVQGRCSPS